MAPLPKRKRSKASHRSHRAHLGLRPLNISRCPQCASPKLPHGVCKVCGTYAGRDVLPVKETPE